MYETQRVNRVPCFLKCTQKTHKGLTPKKCVIPLIAVLFSYAFLISYVAEWSKARVCGCSLAATAGSNPAGDLDVCLL
jgi:hypothetical protein